MGRTESLTWNRLRGEPWLVEQKQHQQQKLPRERNGALRTARIGAPQKCLTLPTLSETGCFANIRVPSFPWGRQLILNGLPASFALDLPGRGHAHRAGVCDELSHVLVHVA